jgi:hypothetical protein
VDHSRFRDWHLVRARRLGGSAAAAVLLVVAAVLVGALTACGGGGGTTVASACARAAAQLPPVARASRKADAAGAARSAAATMAALNLTLGGMSAGSRNPAAMINLRNGTGYLATELRNLAALLTQPGSGLIGPLRVQGDAAYAQLDRSATALGVPECSAVALGHRLFTALVDRTVAPAGPNLREAGAAACQNIAAAYGTTQVAVDRLAALAQLQRSAAALDASQTDLAAVHTVPGLRLRAAIARAGATLDAAVAAVNHGAPPAGTTTAAFRGASAALRDGFRSAGIACAIPAG